MRLDKPVVYKNTFLGDFLNALFLRPPYRKPRHPEPARQPDEPRNPEPAEDSDEMTRKDELFRQLRREILAARLKVTLDEQLGRETSPTVLALSLMELPPIAPRETQNSREVLAWDRGFTAAVWEHIQQGEDPAHPITRLNPYRRQS